MKGALATVADGVLLSASQATIEDPPDVPSKLLGEHTATPYGDHVGIDNVAAARTVVRAPSVAGPLLRCPAALGVNDSDTAVLRDCAASPRRARRMGHPVGSTSGTSYLGLVAAGRV